jgi:hypothetical protein
MRFKTHWRSRGRRKMSLQAISPEASWSWIVCGRATRERDGTRICGVTIPEVRSYHDFETWQLLGVYADGETVFATKWRNLRRRSWAGERYLGTVIDLVRQDKTD